MRHEAECPTCADSARKGLLWLGGKDWVECPSCGGTAILQLNEYRYTPKERTVFVPGLRPHTERKLHPLQRIG